MGRRRVDNPMTARPTDAECNTPHAVYRIYGPDDLLLYIGVAQDVNHRIYMHRAVGTFEITCLYVRHTSEWFPTKIAARAGERAAIKAEAPLFNKQHNPTRWKCIRGAGYEPITPLMTEAEFKILWRQAAGLATAS